MEDSRLTYQEEQLRRGSTSDETKVAGPSKIAHISCGAVITEVLDETKLKDESVFQFAPPKDSESSKGRNSLQKTKGKGWTTPRNSETS